jgi:hypothetical protein
MKELNPHFKQWLWDVLTITVIAAVIAFIAFGCNPIKQAQKLAKKVEGNTTAQNILQPYFDERNPCATDSIYKRDTIQTHDTSITVIYHKDTTGGHTDTIERTLYIHDKVAITDTIIKTDERQLNDAQKQLNDSSAVLASIRGIAMDYKVKTTSPSITFNWWLTAFWHTYRWWIISILVALFGLTVLKYAGKIGLGNVKL